MAVLHHGRFPTWAPAFAGVADWFAGVVLGLAWRGAELQLAASPRSLFSREGGSPVWVPAFAGKQSDASVVTC